MATQTTKHRWLVHRLDIEADIQPLPMQNAQAVYLTVFSGPDPLGTVLVPCGDAVCSAATLRQSLQPFRSSSFEAALRRRFDRRSNGVRPSATVVICTRGRSESLRRCLASVSHLTGGPQEIIVVDNGSGSDGTAEVVAEFDVRYVYESVPGLDRARNRGANEATGDVILYTDDDVEVDPEWAERLIDGFVDPLTVAVTGLVLAAAMDNDGRIEFERHAGFVRTMDPFVLDGTYNDPTSAGRAGAGASMAFRRDYLLSIEGFPEELDGGQATKTGGDTYALYRVLRDGLRIRFQPRALVFHHHRETRESARSAVEGYGTGTISYFAHSARRNQDPAAVAAAVRWATKRTSQLAGSVIKSGAGVQSGYLAAECRGMLRAPMAYAHSRRDVNSRPTVLRDGWEWDPVEASAGSAGEASRRHIDAPNISVIIPTKGGGRPLAATIEALAEQDYDHRLLEIVVADDSADGSAEELVRRIEPALPTTVVRSHGAGAGEARNVGVAASSGELLVFLDDDIRPRRTDHLHLLAGSYRDGADAVVGPILPVTGPGPDLLTLAVRNWWMDQSRSLLEKATPSFTDVCTGNLAVSRTIFERLDGFRPLPRREDWEFGLRLLDLGAEVRVAADAAVDHADHPTVTGGIKRRRLEGRGDVALARLHPEHLPLTRLGGWFEFTPRQMNLIRSTVANPDRALRTATLAARGLPALERAGYRRRFSRLLSKINELSYWAGVGEETGGLEGWLELLSLHHDQAASLGSALELLEAESWEPPAVPTAAVTVRYRGEIVGTAPLRWGGTPWGRDRFADLVVSRFAEHAIRVEAEASVKR